MVLQWLAAHHPQLMTRYDRLYADGAYVPRWYAERLGARVRPLLERRGLARTAFRTAEGDYPAGSLPDLERPASAEAPMEPTLL